MNKTEKLICMLLGAVLAWYLFTQKGAPKRESAVEAQAPLAAESAGPAVSGATQTDQAAQSEAAPETSPVREAPKTPELPEQIVTLENDELKLELSSWGGVVKKATLKKFAQKRGDIGEENPPVEFDFSSSALGSLESAAGGMAGYGVRNVSSNSVEFFTQSRTRKVTLGDNYIVTFEDSGDVPRTSAALSLGSMTMGSSKNDMLSVDSWALDAGKGAPGVIHHSEGNSPLKGYLVAGFSGGCSGSKSAAGMPQISRVAYPGAQTWVALKNRFFVTALVSSTAQITGFDASVWRDMAAAAYRPERVGARATLDVQGSGPVTSVFYVGPKKQSLLWKLGMKDVMEFGMWRWICYPILWVLNAFNDFIPNYGVAIILLTILVRLLFWPLTHKSTVGMKKMQEIQPLLKELQAKYKDNPQRMQQETFALYREHKVNPMSSCLPMLVQIPVFIALFNVLRSAVELRYAPFLWIGDLSEPEALFASWFPFGGLNILPILMALTMGLQSALTPSAGDPKQQKMMAIMMPVMMLVMFYNFPSALSLYWTLSQAVSIAQMWMIRRATQAKNAASMPEVIEPSQTRQMRRHG